MKLSMAMIADYLQRSQYKIDCNIQNDSMRIQGIRFLTEEENTDVSDYVYIGYAEAYFQDPSVKNALILANGKNNIFCKGSNIENLLNSILSAFETYRKFEEKMILASERKKTVQDMLDIVKITQTEALQVFDINGMLLGSVNDSPASDKSLSASGIQRKINPLKMNQFTFRDDGKPVHDLEEYAQILLHEQSTGEFCVARYLVQNGEKIGFIMGFPDTKLEAEKFRCLEDFICPFLSKAVEFSGKASLLQSDHSIMLQLLSGNRVDQVLQERLEHRLGISDTAILTAVKSTAIQNQTMQKSLIQNLEDTYPTVMACEFQDKVLIIMRESQIAEIISQLYRNIHKENILIGFSMPFSDLDALFLAGKQAIFTLETLSGKSSGIQYCRNLAVSYMLSVLRNDFLASSMMHPAIKTLQRQDKMKQGSLLDTMNAYVNHHFNQTETAAALHIHLNTLKYRLHKIQDVTGIDFSDTEETFYLEMSFRL
jgi:hypothetical protein